MHPILAHNLVCFFFVFFVFTGSVGSWPEGATHLYLDGNNLLFVVPIIRRIALKDKRPDLAELVIAGNATNAALCK
jgi:hypothetical protein